MLSHRVLAEARGRFMIDREFFDISPLITEDLAVWPGDVPYVRKVSLDTIKGDHLSLSSISSTLHLGAHADAPRHYHKEGKTIESCDPQIYVGSCQVIKLNLDRNEAIRIDHLRSREIRAKRLLFCTDSYPNPQSFNEDFCFLSPELISYLAERKVILVGIDTPSVDPCRSKKLEVQHSIYHHDMAVLEGLVLTQVPEGLYFLTALPLPISDGDASPVRAVLFTHKFIAHS